MPKGPKILGIFKLTNFELFAIAHFLNNCTHLSFDLPNGLFKSC